MRATLRLLSCGVLAAGALHAVAAAQVAERRSIDRVVAVVGPRAIVLSQIEERLVLMQADAQANGRSFPTDSAGRAAMRHTILDQMVEEELLVQQAERDTTVKVTDQEIQDQVERGAIGRPADERTG